jgi:NAD(P)-dependent dehydrogenase (short-subunit alcohol dehydrogenase family)
VVPTSDEKSAVITGAASGIGRATAYRLLEDGYRFHLLDVDGAGLEVTVEEIQRRGGNAEAWVLDLMDRVRLDEVATEILADRAPAVLVNNAGIGVAARADETSWETWDLMMGVNVNAMYRLCHRMIPPMIEAGGGNVINVSSVAALIGMFNRAAYCATKGAVLSFTRALACDYGTKGIRANAICPGTVSSEWIDKIIASDPDPEERRRLMSARQLDNRMGTPEEIAEGIAFLASPQGRFVNGSGLVMDGGMSIH